MQIKKPFKKGLGSLNAPYYKAAGGGGGGGGPFALVPGGFASNASADSNSALTISTPIDTTGAKLLIVLICDYEAGAGRNLDDSKVNTWLPLSDAANTGNARARLYYSIPTTVGSGHYVEDSNLTAAYCSIYFAAFSDATAIPATPIDVQAIGTGTGSTATAGAGITPTQNNELIIAGVSVSAGTVSSIDSGFTLLGSLAYNAGFSFGGALAYKVQTSAAAVSPTWTLSGSATWAATIASFKAV